MQGSTAMKCLCAVTCILIMVATVTSAAPSYPDYENNISRDLWELLMQREAIEDKLGSHHIDRKSSRSPSLRLRFGRRSDPRMTSPEAAFLIAQETMDRDN